MGEALTRAQILVAAEEVFRRFGPQKTTVVDVARALGVSHGSVYRHFDSKVALRDAVVEAWLSRVSDPLAAIADGPLPPRERLRAWFDALLAAKRAKVTADPQLFLVTREIFAEAREVVAAHVTHLVGQIETIIAAGVAAGVFGVEDPHTTAQAMFDATARFHDPAHAREWSDPGRGESFERVYSLLEAGLLRR